jgi:putative endonuclease
MKSWFVYMAECADGTLYTGISDNVEKRITAHNAGKGAKYTRGRGPVRLAYVEEVKDRGEALKKEAKIKGMKLKDKKEMMLRSL